MPKPPCSSLKSHPVEADNPEITEMGFGDIPNFKYAIQDWFDQWTFPMGSGFRCGPVPRTTHWMADEVDMT